jgi:hypothetical protein
MPHLASNKYFNGDLFKEAPFSSSSSGTRLPLAQSSRSAAANLDALQQKVSEQNIYLEKLLNEMKNS